MNEKHHGTSLSDIDFIHFIQVNVIFIIEGDEIMVIECLTIRLNDILLRMNYIHLFSRCFCLLKYLKCIEVWQKLCIEFEKKLHERK